MVTVTPLPIEGVPVNCTCRWEWLPGPQQLSRVLNAGCVVHGDPDSIVVAWLLTPAFIDYALGYAFGIDPLRELPRFCMSAIQVARSDSVAGRVWRALGHSWDSVDWSAVISRLRESR